MVSRVIPVEVFDLVIFGATGDLARRKILPGLYRRYLAGQIPENNPGADMRVQTEEVLGHVERLLNEAGSSKAHILMCQIFIREAQDIAAMNAVWDAWIVPGHTPPRATVIAPAINPDYRIEVIVTAAQIAAD